MACGGLLYGTGFGVAALGVSSHNIGLMYFGNLLCGIGYGCAYTPPIQACLDWFPDRKGLASGIVIAGFGSGALFFTPMMGYLSNKFASMPTYLGNNLDIVTEGGKQFVRMGAELQEVVHEQNRWRYCCCACASLVSVDVPYRRLVSHEGNSPHPHRRLGDGGSSLDEPTPSQSSQEASPQGK